MVTVAEFVPVLGKNSKVSLTSLQWILMATEWASAAVAAPRTRPTVISKTAAIFVFGLMTSPFQFADTTHRYAIGGKGKRVIRTMTRGAGVHRRTRFCRTTTESGQAR